MKRATWITLGVFILGLGFVAPSYAQREPREQEGKPGKQEDRPRREQQQPSPEKQERQEPARRSQEPKQQPRPERQERKEPPRRTQEPQQLPRPAKPERAQPVRRPQEPQQQRPNALRPPPAAQPPSLRPPQPAQRSTAAEHRAVWQQRQAGNWQAEHRTWQQRGGYLGYRIPHTRFHGAFGPSHGFRMFSHPVLVIEGFPRFEFAGFWFSVMDPWPEYWSNEWYSRDDVYIEDSEGGYYLRNRRHPGDRIAITVYLN